MAADDLFKRYLEVGASVLGMSRERAEAIVRDLVASGEVARGQATKAADWLVERGRTGTEELAEMIRREIRHQVTAMGLATQEDIARLEARLEEATAAASAPGPAATTPTAAPTRTRAAATARRTAPAAAGVKKAETAGKTSATPSLAKAAPAAKGTKAPPGGGPASGRSGAGITRSGSVAKRSGRAGSVRPDAAPSPDQTAPPKG